MSALQRAEQVTRQILASQPGTGQLVLDSPPGAGKTGVVERLAVQGAWVHGERVMIATQTNGQAFDLARRLAEGWPNCPVHLFTRRGLPIPEPVSALPGVQVLTSLADLPDGPGVVIANAAKWSYTDIPNRSFELLIVDEAYQLRDAGFAQIAGLAARHVLVGDPGQIAPVTSTSTARWQAMADGPHVPAPQALLARRPQQTLRLALPASRRLPPDSVQLIQPVFYPQLPFVATAAADERRLLVDPAAGHRLDGVIDQAAAGASIGLLELPERVTGEFDGELAGELVATIARLLERGARTQDERWGERPLLPGDIGVVCAHRSQVYAVQEQLGDALQEVHVETADRWQGLERQVMLVHHPLSGRLNLQDFQLDAGRLCVMLSRHRISCLVLARAGVAARLAALPPQVQRVLGEVERPVGAQVHRELLRQLQPRTVQLPAAALPAVSAPAAAAGRTPTTA